MNVCVLANKRCESFMTKLSACLDIYSTFTTERYIGTTISGPGLT